MKDNKRDKTHRCLYHCQGQGKNVRKCNISSSFSQTQFISVTGSTGDHISRVQEVALIGSFEKYN